MTLKIVHADSIPRARTSRRSADERQVAPAECIPRPSTATGGAEATLESKDGAGPHRGVKLEPYGL